MQNGGGGQHYYPYIQADRLVRIRYTQCLAECMDNNVVHLLHFALQSVTLGVLGPGVLPDLFPVAPGKEIGVFV